MSDSWLDIERDKIAEWKMQRHFARQDYCNKECEYRGTPCPYYDAEQEAWDYELCFQEEYIFERE